MDERYTCLKKDDVQEFHNHLNSVKPNIQFTKEVEEDSRLFGIPNHQGVWRDTSVFIRKHRTKTDWPRPQLPSPSPARKISCGYIPSQGWTNTIDRSRTIQRAESIHCGWSKLGNRTANPLATFLTTATLPSWFGSDLAVISCQRHLWENLTNVTPQQCRFPLNVLRARFPRPKDPTLQPRGVVYKIGCLDGDFCYYGQTNWVLATQDKRVVRGI